MATARLDRPMLNAGSCSDLYPLIASGAHSGIFIDVVDYSNSVPERIERQGGRIINVRGNNPRVIDFHLGGRERTIFFMVGNALDFGRSLTPKEASAGLSFYYTAGQGGPPPTDAAIRAVVKGGFVLTNGMFGENLDLSLLGLKLIATDDPSRIYSRSLYQKVGEITGRTSAKPHCGLSSFGRWFSGFRDTWHELVNLDISRLKEKYEFYSRGMNLDTSQGKIDLINHAINQSLEESSINMTGIFLPSVARKVRDRIMGWLKSETYDYAPQSYAGIDRALSDNVRGVLKNLYCEWFKDFEPKPNS